MPRSRLGNAAAARKVDAAIRTAALAVRRRACSSARFAIEEAKRTLKRLDEPRLEVRLSRVEGAWVARCLRRPRFAGRR